MITEQQARDIIDAHIDDYANFHVCTPSELLAAFREVERRTVEACAKACEDKAAAHMNDPGRDDYYSCVDSRADECEQLAEAIRAMLDAPTAEQEKFLGADSDEWAIDADEEFQMFEDRDKG